MRSLPTGAVEDSSSALFPVGRSGTPPESPMPVGGLRMTRDFQHEPVMVDFVVAVFGPVPAGVVVDGTAGGGGHAAALLRTHPHVRVLAIDRDPDAVAAATTRLAAFGERAVVRRGRFGDLAAIVAEERASGDLFDFPHAGTGGVSGVLLDLGVSSPQLDRAERGFSYRFDAPLDMRMDPTTGASALDLVNTMDERELAALFAASGEGRLSRRIARSIIDARPVTTTGRLAEVVAAAVPMPARRRGHPARRVFQALRIAVNDELTELSGALAAGLPLLAVGGRMAVIAYHSGEDRLVKGAFADAVTGGCVCPPGLPCVCGARPEHRLVFRGSRTATPEEVARNHRAEGARLRVIERMEPEVRA